MTSLMKIMEKHFRERKGNIRGHDFFLEAVLNNEDSDLKTKQNNILLKTYMCMHIL